MKKISIIIPVYNSSKHLIKCIDSILGQTMSSDDYAIICVDDGSTDNSLKILNKYKRNNPNNFTVIQMDRNSGGAGAPRNKGLTVANSKYIFFLDSDDYLGEEALERMYNFATTNDSDVVIGKYEGVNGRSVPKSPFLNGNVKKADLIENSLMYSLSALKLFKKDVIDAYDIRFPENTKITEDMIFCLKFFCNCKTISIYEEYSCYFATLHDGKHLTKSNVPPKDYFATLEDLVSIIKESNTGDIAYKNKLTASLLTRLFMFGHNENFCKSITMSHSEKVQWIHEYSKFINENINETVDTFIPEYYKNKLQSIRDNDLTKLKLSEDIAILNYAIQQNNNKITELQNTTQSLCDTINKLINIISTMNN